MPKVNVSFKNTTKDIKLYTLVVAQEEKSEFVKECITFWIEHNKKESKSRED